MIEVIFVVISIFDVIAIFAVLVIGSSIVNVAGDIALEILKAKIIAVIVDAIVLIFCLIISLP